MMISKMPIQLGTLLLLQFVLVLTHSSKATISTSSLQLQVPQNIDVNSTFTSFIGKKRRHMNTIDSCWRSNPSWATNRQSLVDCAVGFGKNAMGGQGGMIYIVNDNTDHAINPKPGTLRYGVTRDQPLWIIFQRDMVITLENELIINNHKTIDGRGARIEITKGPCITIEHVKHVIIHGISIHDCRRGRPGLVQNTPTHRSKRRGCDGDGIKITNSSNIWIDHCYLSNSTDGLIDAIHASHDITISNSRFTHHVKVMLLGHQDGYEQDRVLKATLAFNHFGPELRERMPRLRYGYAHVVNNYYEPWLLYAIGGSSDPTILSEANYFLASDDPKLKEVTKREGPTSNGDWKNWRWTSKGDMFVNGAYFLASGVVNGDPPYAPAQKFRIASGRRVPALTSSAGPLFCVPNRVC